MDFVIWRFSRLMWRMKMPGLWFDRALYHWMKTDAGKQFLAEIEHTQ